jgi:two-component system cell cycle sensor histidine kinase/response regulator CckA
VIFGGVSLLRLRSTSGRDAEALEVISTSAGRAAELTCALFALGRRQIAVARPKKLSSVLAEARPLLEKALTDAARLEVVEGAGDCTVRVDPGQLQLVLLNLVMNARDASPAGAPVKLVARPVDLVRDSAARPAELPPGRHGAVEVSDSGAGIAPEVFPRIPSPSTFRPANPRPTCPARLRRCACTRASANRFFWWKMSRACAGRSRRCSKNSATR